MAQTLDDMLQALADAGNFSHLSIVARTDAAGQKYPPLFNATFVPSQTWGQGHGTGTNPVDAAILAIENAPKGAKVKSPKVHSSAPVAKTERLSGYIDEAPSGQTNEPTTSLMALFTAPVTETD